MGQIWGKEITSEFNQKANLRLDVNTSVLIYILPVTIVLSMSNRFLLPVVYCLIIDLINKLI